VEVLVEATVLHSQPVLLKLISLENRTTFLSGSVVVLVYPSIEHP